MAAMNDPFEGNPVLIQTKPIEVRKWLRNFYSYPEYRGMTVTGLTAAELVAKTRCTLRDAKRMCSDNLKNVQMLEKTTQKHIENTKSNSCMVCTNLDPTCVLMWSHYSQGHAGYCFELKKLSDNYIKGQAVPIGVDYVEQRSTLSTIDILNMIANSRHGDNRISDEKSAIKTTGALLWEKSQAWAYEQEYRFVDLIDHKPGYRKLQNYKLSKIILGLRCSTETEHTIRTVVGSRLPIVKAQIASDTYSIEIPLP